MLKLAKSVLSASIVFGAIAPALAGEPPQALGLVATAEPIPINCEGTHCTANLSAFCLQQKRRSPSPTDRYRQAAAGKAVITAKSRSGETITVDGLDMTFQPDPEYTSVRVSIAHKDIAHLDANTLRVAVGNQASLLPVGYTLGADADAAVGPHREVAAQFFENNTERTEAVQMVNRLINALPRTARTGQAERQSLWDKTQKLQSEHKVEEWIGTLYRNCGKAADMSPRLTLRKCLANWHHRSLSKTNKTFWSALAGV